ncbi:SRPBCC family protein [bacterium]|nr:MAG: SRPBCC family protein [bacterium]
MQTFRTEIQIDSNPDQVFAYVTDFENMDKYLTTLHHASPAGEGKIEVEGEVEGHHYDRDGWFEKDEAERTMEWGSNGASVYNGHLAVRELMGNSLLEIMLNFGAQPGEEAEFEQTIQSRGPAIQDGLERAAQAIRANVEGVRVSDGAYVA